MSKPCVLCGQFEETKSLICKQRQPSMKRTTFPHGCNVCAFLIAESRLHAHIVCNSLNASSLNDLKDLFQDRQDVLYLKATRDYTILGYIAAYLPLFLMEFLSDIQLPPVIIILAAIQRGHVQQQLKALQTHATLKDAVASVERICTVQKHRFRDVWTHRYSMFSPAAYITKRSIGLVFAPLKVGPNRTVFDIVQPIGFDVFENDIKAQNFLTGQQHPRRVFESYIPTLLSVDSYAQVALEFARTLPDLALSDIVKRVFRKPIDLTTKMSWYMSAWMQHMVATKIPSPDWKFRDTVWYCLVRTIETMSNPSPKSWNESLKLLHCAAFSKGFDIFSTLPKMLTTVRRKTRASSVALAIIARARENRTRYRYIAYWYYQLSDIRAKKTSAPLRTVVNQPLFEPQLVRRILEYSGHATHKRRKEKELSVF